MGKQAGRQREQPLYRQHQGTRFTKLAADVAVQPRQVHTLELQCLPGHGLGRAVGQGEPEFGGGVAGAGVAVGVHVDVGVDAQPDGLAPALAAGQLVHQRQLARVIDDDAADIGRERLCQLRRRLVIAVEVDAVGGEAGAQGDS